MFPFEFIVLVMMLVMLVMAFVFKDYVFGAIAGMLFMIFGIYVGINGMIGFSNLLTSGLATVCIGVGAYVFIRGGVEAMRGD